MFAKEYSSFLGNSLSHLFRNECSHHVHYSRISYIISSSSNCRGNIPLLIPKPPHCSHLTLIIVLQTVKCFPEYQEHECLCQIITSETTTNSIFIYLTRSVIYLLNLPISLPFFSSFSDDSFSLSSACFKEADTFSCKFVIGSSGLKKCPCIHVNFMKKKFTKNDRVVIFNLAIRLFLSNLPYNNKLDC